MGKNQRHKKNLKVDKAKVKLKQTKTKFLPKGQNVTDTTFKIKPIVLQEQLKEKSEDAPLSKRKLDIKDLLSRMKHYNENVRHKACTELVEMVKLHSEEIINHHLSIIILTVSTLMQDKERKVRKAAINVVSAILDAVPEEKLHPFYHYFLVNLRCAMTNINKNIQEDSLMFLDCFLMYDCKLITKNPDKLLPDFFTLISKLRSDSKLDRTLIVNLHSKMTSVTWRIKVLSRLHGVLQKILTESSNNTADIEMCTVFDAEVSNTFSLYDTIFCEKLSNSNWEFPNNIPLTSATDNLEKNIATVVPLLYETWVEVMPDKKSTNPSTDNNTILNDEAAAILSCVMNTLYLLWKYVIKFNNEYLVKKVFLSAEGKKFLDHLVMNFPYKKTENIKKGKMSNELKLLDMNTDTKCYKENLLICLIYSSLNINISRRSKNKEIHAIIKYILDLLLGKCTITESNVYLLLEFLKMCLLENHQIWREADIDLRLILTNAIEFYNNKYLSNRLKLEMFKLFVDLVDVPFVQKNDQYLSWLELLPNLLTGSVISDFQVNCLLNMSKRGSSIFHEALNKKIPKIMENLNDLEIIMTNSSILNTEEIVRNNIATIFFYIPKIGKIKGNFILDFISTHQESKFAKNFENMIKLRKEFKRQGFI